MDDAEILNDEPADRGHSDAARWFPLIPDEATIRPCAAIARGDSGQNYAALYRGLTEQLPLAGAKLMRAGPSGEIALTARLRAAAPWLEPAISLIDRQLRIQNWAGRPWIAWRPLCLVGPPGCGKSHLARLIGTLAGLGHGVLDLAGVSDNRTLEGTPRGWTNAQPCWPALMIDQTVTANPVLVLEEVEKAGGSDRNGKPLETLLTMIEAETATRFYDKCLLAEVDLSHVCWILTCNTVDTLPAPLRSRLDIVEVAGPSPAHFDALLVSVLADLADRWGVPRAMLPELPAKALATLRQAFVRTRSARRLRRHVEAVLSALIPSERGLTH